MAAARDGTLGFRAVDATRITLVRVLPEILQPREHNVDPILVTSQYTRPIQQLLKNLVIGRERNSALPAKLVNPERERPLEGFRRESGGNRDLQKVGFRGRLPHSKRQLGRTIGRGLFHIPQLRST